MNGGIGTPIIAQNASLKTYFAKYSGNLEAPKVLMSLVMFSFFKIVFIIQIISFAESFKKEPALTAIPANIEALSFIPFHKFAKNPEF